MTKLPDELRIRINHIPDAFEPSGDGDGWFKAGSRDTFIKLATLMWKRGLGSDDIYDILCEAYWAVASCYGG